MVYAGSGETILWTYSWTYEHINQIRSIKCIIMASEIPKLFGTSGIRGKIGSEITLELAVEIGMAIATYLVVKGVKCCGL